MNIFADENIPQQIVTQLRAAGHKVEYVMQQVEDRIILEEAYKQQALLITSDKDFGRLVLDEGKGTLLCRTGDGRHDAAASGTYAVERSMAVRPS